MGSGKGQSNATSTTAPNPAAMSNYYDLLNRANQVGSTPYQPYTGNLLAPFSQSQQTAFNTIDQSQGIANADIGQAQNYAQQGAAPITGQQIAGYENPYQNQVINATLGQIQYLDANQQAQMESPWVGSGGLFNDRLGVAQGQLAYNQDLANNQTLSQLNTQNYSQALAAAQAQQAAYAGASYQFGNLGAEQQATTLQGAQAQLGSGGIQQQQAQQGLNIPYQQFLQAQAFPYQQVGWEAGIDTGVGSQMGGTSNTTYQPAAPNPWNVGLGLGLAGVGAFYGGPQGAAAGWGIGSNVKRGGRIKGYDDGGDVGSMPYSGARSFIPSYGITRGQGAPRPPYPMMPRTGAGAGRMNLGQLGGLPSRWSASGITAGDMADMPTGPANGGLGGLYRRGGAVGYADGGGPDDIDLPPAYQPSDAGPRGLFRAFTPGLYNYFTADRPPPSTTPNAAGKVPSGDPYAGPALEEATGLGMMALPFGRAESLAVRGAEAMGGRGAMRTLGDVGAGIPMPGGRGIAAAGAGAAGAASLSDTAEAFDALGPRPTIESDEQAQVDRLNKEISGLTAQRARATDPNKVGPKGAAIQGAPFDAQIGQRNTSIRAIMDQVASRQQAYDERLADFAKKTAPFATRNPEANEALSAAPVASAASGAILGGFAGRKIAPFKRAATYGAAGLGGGLEGLVGGYYPTYADLHMPEGSAAKTQAEAREGDPRFWEHGVLPEVGMSAASGLLGAKYGMLRRDAKPVAAAIERAPSPLPALATETTGNVGKAWPVNADGSRKWPSGPNDPAMKAIDVQKRSGGGYYDANTGHTLPKTLWPSQPGGKIVPLQAAESRGGAVSNAMRIARRLGGRAGYDDGGPTFGTDDSMWRSGYYEPNAPNPAPGPSWGDLASLPLSGGPPSVPASAASIEPPGPTIPGRPDFEGATFAPGVAEAIRSVRPDGTMSPEAWTAYEASSPLGPGSRGVTVPPGGVGDVSGAPPYGISNHSQVYGGGPQGVAGPQADGQGPFGTDRSRFGNALMTAGLSLAASRSPYLGQAVGEAGLAGIGSYREEGRYQNQQQQKQQQFNLEQSKVDAQVKRLDQQMDLSRAATERYAKQNQIAQDREAEAERHNREQEARAASTTGLQPGYRWNADRTAQEFVPGGPHDPAVIKAQKDAEAAGKATGAGEGDIDPVTLKRTAEMYNLTGPSALTNLGRGQQSSKNIMAIRTEAARQDEENGVTSEQRAQVQAQYAGQKSAQRTLGTQEVKMGTAGFEARGAIQLGRDAIERVPRTSFLPLNQLIQGFQKQTLSPDQAELYTRTQGIINAYAAVMARGANVTTDASRHRAEELLNTASDPAVYNRVLDTMNSEIEMAINAPDKMRDFYMKKYGKKSSGAPGVIGAATDPLAGAAAPAATGVPSAPTGVPPGSSYSPSRKMWRTPDGKLFDATGRAMEQS